MEAISGNTNLGSNTLDSFTHGGNYGVTTQTAGMDVFTVDSASRVPTAQPIQPRPPSYNTATRARTTTDEPPPPPLYSSVVPPPPPWSIVNNPNTSQNTVANGSTMNGKAKIYDPNEDSDSLND